MGKEISIPDGIITNKIYLIRNQKVMLDRDLAEHYQAYQTVKFFNFNLLMRNYLQ